MGWVQQIGVPNYGDQEIWNCMTHAFGVGIILHAIIHLLRKAKKRGDKYAFFSDIIFGLSLTFMFGVSTIYHALPYGNGLKVIFRYLDHCGCFIGIAGSYTPCVLAPELRKSKGWFLFFAVWILSIIGSLMKLFYFVAFEKYALYFFFFVAWLALLDIKTMWNSWSKAAFFWILGEGVLYSIGTIFFSHDEEYKYFHAIWHMFSLLGSFCHIMCVEYCKI